MSFDSTPPPPATLSIDKREPRNGEAAKNAAHKERMRTRRAEDRVRRWARRAFLT